MVRPIQLSIVSPYRAWNAFLEGKLYLHFVFYTMQIDHFTVVCSVTWPLNGSEAGSDLALIKTSLLLSCK